MAIAERLQEFSSYFFLFDFTGDIFVAHAALKKLQTCYQQITAAYIAVIYTPHHFKAAIGHYGSHIIGGNKRAGIQICQIYNINNAAAAYTCIKRVIFLPYQYFHPGW